MREPLHVLMILAVLGGCSSGNRLCAAGSTLTCFCDLGQPGVALCLDGERVGACQCSLPEDLAMPEEDMVQDLSNPNLRWVFVTRTSFRGNFQATASADSICQDRAARAGVARTGHAWISWTDPSAIGSEGSRLGLPDMDSREWFLVPNSGRPASMVLQAKDLTPYQIYPDVDAGARLDYDEYGYPLGTNPQIWCSSRYMEYTCSGWTTAQAYDMGPTGTFCIPAGFGLEADYRKVLSCNEEAHILCLEK